MSLLNHRETGSTPPIRLIPLSCGLLASLLGSSTTSGFFPSDSPRPIPPGTHFYSSVLPPSQTAGATPAQWNLAPSLADPPSGPDETNPPPSPREEAPANPSPNGESGLVPPPDRLASASPSPGPRADRVDRLDPASSVQHAMDIILQCREKFRSVQDYTCTFHKKERIDGQLTPLNVMKMKARTKPHSIYFKFLQPNAGREAIYVEGRNGGKAWVHDVGIGRLLAGTLSLDPLSKRAMEGNRHPITNAGLGYMIDSIIRGWEAEMRPDETQVEISTNLQVDRRPCTLIVSRHPRYNRAFQFHEIRVYIDDELRLPVRFEAYDWPRRPGAKPELLEEYTYTNLKLNVGLTELDFDPSNHAYSFGRF